jgi:hypothetical protein
MPSSKERAIESLTNAILAQESGGRFDALGPEITDPRSSHQGDRALGAFQVMPNTLHGFFKDPDFRIQAKMFSDAQPSNPIPAIATEPELEQAFLRSEPFQRFIMGKLLESNAGSAGVNLDEPSEDAMRALALAHYAGAGKASKFMRGGAISNEPVMTAGGVTAPSPLQYVNEVMGRIP